MSEYDILPKCRKIESPSKCIICDNTNDEPLHKPKNLDSWQTLLKKAKIKNFRPILNAADLDLSDVPFVVQYHKECRKNFLKDKELDELTDTVRHTHETSQPRKSIRKMSSSDSSRVYKEECIFCEKVSKYIKGKRTRERLTQAVDIRADTSIRESATRRCDERILAITSREIVAAEAHYHESCYKQYTKPMKNVPVSVNETYNNSEKIALGKFYAYIRSKWFADPKILSLVDITQKFCEFLEKEGGQITNSAKKNLRRNLESEFKDNLQFFTTNQRVYVRPYNLTIDALSCDVVRLESKFAQFNNSKTCDELIENTASIIRDSIKSVCCTDQVWPPYPEELNESYVTLPDCLMKFLSIVLSGSQTALSDRISRCTWSIAQDIINVTTNAKILTPKHVLLSYVVKTLTGNVELIRTLNRLGHSCSYTKLQEIDTAICIEKIDRNVNGIPGGIYPRVPTVLAFDNIDRREETLSGEGTTHRINGIIVQPVSHSCAPQREGPITTKKDKKRTIDSIQDTLPVYVSGKRTNPPQLKPPNLCKSFTDATTNAQHRNMFWLLARFQDKECRICSWTGFNIKTQNDVTVSPDTVGYLPTINSPPSQLATVQEILCQSDSIRQNLDLNHMAVVMDQALYAKATEIVWKHEKKFQHIVLMMGNFHIICNFISIIGKLYGPAGLRDLAVESGVVAEGSVDKALSGQQYNRGVRLLKIVYEAMMQFVWTGFEDWLENNGQYNKHLDETVACITNKSTFESFMENEHVKKILHLYEVYKQELRCENGQLSMFWMQFLDMVEILLGLIRADRQGDWCLHLACIREMIPYCFAMDKTNYSRYLPVYYYQMMDLANVSSELKQHFINGGFATQLNSSNPFGKIAIDQTLEETVNKDTQTAGGTRGFSTSQGTVSKYYLTAEHRAQALRQLRNIISTKCLSGHPDLQQSRILRDQSDVSAVCAMLDSSLTNPFEFGNSDLVNISTGVIAPKDASSDMLKAREKGEEAFLEFAKRLEKGEGFYEPIKKLKLKTFADLHQKKVFKGQDKEVILKADNRIFGQMLLIAENRKLSMDDVLSYPLGPKPWALANGDGTIKKTDKSKLATHLEKESDIVEMPTHGFATIIDGMSIVQKCQGDNFTFEEVSQKVFDIILSEGRGGGRIDVVFDTYRTMSIKNAERVNRGADGIIFHEIKSGHRIKNWKRFLAIGENKNKLIEYLITIWQSAQYRQKLNGVDLFVTSGEKCVRITNNFASEMAELTSNHEEADTRLLIHAKHAALTFAKILVISEDTDVFVLFLGFHSEITGRILIRRGKKNKVRVIDLSRLGTIIGQNVCSALVGLHAWTGCDTISAFGGRGKVKACDLIRKDQRFQDTFVKLGHKWRLDDDIFTQIETFTCNMYSYNTKITDVNSFRYEMFRTKRGDLTSGQMPPCRDALYQHTQRANYQAAIWRRSLQLNPEIPVPTHGHGWTLYEGELTIQWISIKPAPEAIMSFMFCKCPRACKTGMCTCLDNGMRCTPACKLQNCGNWNDENESFIQDASDSDDDDDEA